MGHNSVLIFLVMALLIILVITAFTSESNSDNCVIENYNEVQMKAFEPNIRLFTRKAAQDMGNNLRPIMRHYMMTENKSLTEKLYDISTYPLYYHNVLKMPIYDMYMHFEQLNMNPFDKRKDIKNINEAYYYMVVLISRGYSKILSEHLHYLRNVYFSDNGGYHSDKFIDSFINHMGDYMFRLMTRIMLTEYKEDPNKEVIVNDEAEAIINNQIIDEVKTDNNDVKSMSNDRVMKEISKANNVDELLRKQDDDLRDEVTPLTTNTDNIKGVLGIDNGNFNGDILDSVPQQYNFTCAELDRGDIRLFVDNKRIDCSDKAVYKL